MRKAAIASAAADSYSWVGCTGSEGSDGCSSSLSFHCASLAGLLPGNDSAHVDGQPLPKQQPASVQPMRPKARPTGTTMPAMSAPFQNGKRSAFSKNHAAMEAPMKPP